ncbi:intercompartmental signaling factor BofC [Aquibacillus albus]|uniref:Forespore regulator of the sigma-K checkpoint n=1 Tax=Aquibacillus albus TaxID=1168171 RepID=A0ABS2MUI9_9BACI|nr:intercompartmental signaling factor BofC [Aquibacillus albus]MBM7569537.1 forespore regulator of the sigma-K checkpoint [Aquibacillus albus]
MKKHLFLIALSVIIVFGGVTISDFVQADNKKGEDEESIKREPLKMEVTLQKQYMDGRVEEETHTETVWAMEDFWAYYDAWQLVNQEQGKIVFKKQISDISPYLKENGYFGLKNDILTIFEGRPEEQQVIQSFYQIDTSDLESYQAKQLKSGIKIDSKDVYEYVLEAFREMTPSRSVSS